MTPSETIHLQRAAVSVLLAALARQPGWERLEAALVKVLDEVDRAFDCPLPGEADDRASRHVRRAVEFVVLEAKGRVPHWDDPATRVDEVLKELRELVLVGTYCESLERAVATVVEGGAHPRSRWRQSAPGADAPERGNP